MNSPAQFLTYQLVTAGLVLVAVYLLSRTGALWSGIRKRLAVIVSGAMSGLLPVALNPTIPAFPDRSFMYALSGALSWLVVYEIAGIAQHRLGGAKLRFLLLVGVLYWFLAPVVTALVTMIYFALENPNAGNFQTFSQGASAQTLAGTWIGLALNHALFTSVFIGTFYLLQNQARGLRARTGGFWQTGGFGSIGGLDMETTTSRSQTTRLLCASAFLAGSQFRHAVLNYLDDPNRATAPEPGLDLGLVAQLCKYAENRSRRYDWFFFVCLATALIVTGIGAAVAGTEEDLSAGLIIGVIVLVLTAGAVYLRKSWREEITLPRSFTKNTFDPEKCRSELRADLEPEAYTSLPSDNQNLIVYQGFSPFVGAGTSLGGWSFVINIDKGKEDETGAELKPIKFQSSELYAEVEQLLNSLGLNGLIHQDMYFVNGSDIRDDRSILPHTHGRPVQAIASENEASYRTTNDRRIRHYKWIRVMDWGSELCTSYYLRCTLRGSNMFVEINRYLLTPLADQYRKIDALAETRWQKTVGLVIRALIVGPLRAIASPFVLFQRFNELIAKMFDQKQKIRERLIDENPLYNYGTGSSLREFVSSYRFMHYFQKLDGDFYTKVLEREILAAIVNFLDEHNVDTSEFKERQSTILNSGIIIHGGDVTAQSLAVGSGAQASVARPAPESTKPKLGGAAKEAAA